MSRKFSYLALVLSLLLLASTANAKGLGGTVYVPNLHAKCLSGHQERLLECAEMEIASPGVFEDGETISVTAKDCADDSLLFYRQCEDTLVILRKLDRLSPIKARSYAAQGKAYLKMLEEREHGGYPE